MLPGPPLCSPGATARTAMASTAIGSASPASIRAARRLRLLEHVPATHRVRLASSRDVGRFLAALRSGLEAKPQRELKFGKTTLRGGPDRVDFPRATPGAGGCADRRSESRDGRRPADSGRRPGRSRRRGTARAAPRAVKQAGHRHNTRACYFEEDGGLGRRDDGGEEVEGRRARRRL